MVKHKPEPSVNRTIGSIEEELNSIWFLVSPQEKRRREVIFKMARLRATLHRLKIGTRLDFAKPRNAGDEI
jgi:hypothetical protein